MATRAVQWPPRPLLPLRQGLDELAEAVRNRPRERSDTEQIWLTRFLVIRTCGHLEQVAYETARGYISVKSGGLVRAFAESWLAHTKNPTPDNLLELVGRFKVELRDNLNTLFEKEDQRLRREISFLVNRRNKIAHGMSEGVGTTKALSLKADAQLVGDWIVANLDPG